MNSIKIEASGMYLPKRVIENDYFKEIFNIDEDWISKRTGIKRRYWVEKENEAELAIKAVENLTQKNEFDLQKIGLIIVASTNFEDAMPSISFQIQKKFNIENCMCMDILAGCSGYINALDIARKYIELDEIESALVIGVEKLSKYLDKNDINTAILLGDGAGATIVTKAKNKLYDQNIESIGKYGDLLTCKENSKIYMDGKKVYKFATTKVSENIKKLLEKQKLKTHDIKLIIPHQSNVKIIGSIAEKIGALPEQIYINLDHIGNTFNASIPIAIDEVINKKLLKDNDKIILAGYGGGLNLGSILIEI